MQDVEYDFDIDYVPKRDAAMLWSKVVRGKSCIGQVLYNTDSLGYCVVNFVFGCSLLHTIIQWVLSIINVQMYEDIMGKTIFSLSQIIYLCPDTFARGC